MAIKNHQKLVNMIVEKMIEQAQEAGTNRAEVDVSGGIDSAVVAALSCKAFGVDNVIGVYSSINSSKESRERARLVAEKFGFKMLELDLSPEFSSIVRHVASEFTRLGIPWPDTDKYPTVLGSFRSCLRAPIGRFVNRAFMGGIRQGTGNRDEDELVRFYQKGGDGEVDCNWIAGLFKSEVWELAEYLNVPQEIIDALPTPDLWGTGDQHNDEQELSEWAGVPMTYTRPGGPMGSIEWVSRENEKHGVVEFTRTITDEVMRDEFGYSDEQIAVVNATRKIEKMTRHKAFPPPHLDRETLKLEGCVE